MKIILSTCAIFRDYHYSIPHHFAQVYKLIAKYAIFVSSSQFWLKAALVGIPGYVRYLSNVFIFAIVSQFPWLSLNPGPLNPNLTLSLLHCTGSHNNKQSLIMSMESDTCSLTRAQYRIHCSLDWSITTQTLFLVMLGPHSHEFHYVL